MNVSWLFVPCLTMTFVAAAATRVPAQDYPTRQVTIVVPFTPAGSTDILARMFGQKLEQRLGKPFLIENRPGAGTQIGATAVAKSAPDGHVLLVAPSPTMAANVTVYKKLPYDPARDFAPVALLAHIPFVLVVNPSLPVNSAADLIKLAKERPGQLSFGSGGVGITHHLFGELLKSMTGIQMAHVPYKGSVPALNDVVAGHIQLMFSDLAPALPLIAAGKLRALGVSTAKRVAAAPHVPPLAETGVPGYDAASWQMMSARAGTPKAILDRLSTEMNAFLGNADIQKQLTEMGMIPGDPSTPAELHRFVESEIVRWGKLVHQAGAAGLE
jgi:tripartite-type tricarboxylate transporter receptor subunit TctC